ncbi:MAG TPA: hypothetical protein VHZ51_30445, partial [Ktedonobacteraceae bacterium]|nr:hypothetical protein [Ktedonobacteraceae bacterium]
NTTTGKVSNTIQQKFETNVSVLSWSPDHTRLAIADGNGFITIWNIAQGHPVAIYGWYSTRRDDVAVIIWSPNGKYIASSSSNETTVEVWEAATGKDILRYYGHRNFVDAVAWSPDGKRLATGSTDNTAQVWDALTGDNASIYQGHQDRVLAVAWSPDGKYVASGSGDATTQIWLAPE